MLDDARTNVGPEDADMCFFTSGSEHPRVFEVVAERQPEGVWLATCDEIPGLILETDSLEEVEQEVGIWGKELARDNGVIALGDQPNFIIRRAGGSWTNGNHSVQSRIRAVAT